MNRHRTLLEQLQRAGSFISGKKGVVLLLGGAMVLGAKFVLPCTIGLGRSVERCFLYILRDCREGGDLKRFNKE